MSFLNGAILWNLLWIVPLILVLALAGNARRNTILHKMFGTNERVAQFSNASRGKRVFRLLLLSGAILLTVVAAARPSWGKQVMQDTSTGRDLLVLFDVSKSMLSDDVKPSRMDHAKWLVRELVKKNPGDRFGLIAFAGESFLICPLTVDRTSFIQLVDDLDTDTIPIGGTNVQLALEEAVQAFKGAQGTHKAVILVTDGDELTGRGASVVGDLAKAQIPVLAVGVGDPSNPAVIRVKDERGQLRVLTDREGNPVKSPLNEPQLTELARRTGGMYVRSTAAFSGVDELETRIKMLDRKESEDSVSMFRPIERPAYPLAVALFLLALFFCVSETRPRTIQTALAVAALICLGFQPELRAQTPQTVQPVPAQVQAVAPQDAGEEIEAPEPEPSRSPSELYNLGLDQQQVEHDDEKARGFYERAIAASEKEPLVRASAYQNIGVISHLDARTGLQDAMQKLQAQDLDGAEKGVGEALTVLNRAEDLYRESMRSHSGDASVIRNQQLLLADRKQAEELKKQIEELKKLMEQARQQTQQAHDQQQQENQQNQQDQQQSGEQDQQQQNRQDQQQQSDNQQSGEQDQQQQNQQDQQQSGEQNQQDQQSAQDSASQAEQAVSELEQKASEMNQERQQQAAQQAKEEIQKAREEQERGNGEKAEEHLKNALDQLTQNQQPQQDQQEDDSGEQDQQQQDQSGEQDQQPAEPRQEESAQEAPQDQGDMDKQQAEAILNMMSKDELDFKDANQTRQSGRLNNYVEKDW